MTDTFAFSPIGESSYGRFFADCENPTTSIGGEIGIVSVIGEGGSPLLAGHGQPATHVDWWKVAPCSPGASPSSQPTRAGLAAPTGARPDAMLVEACGMVRVRHLGRRGTPRMPPGLAQPTEAIGNGDQAFAALLAGQARPLASYARRLTNGSADADDLVQDTMLRCWAARHRFQPGSNFAAWARTVMRNSFLSGRRRARFQADLPEEALDRLLGVASTQEQAMELRDAERALAELSVEHRAAVVLASQGMTVEEAAAQLGIAEGTYKSRVARARARLRGLIEDCNTTPLLLKPVSPSWSEPKRRGRGNWKGMMIG